MTLAAFAALLVLIIGTFIAYMLQVVQKENEQNLNSMTRIDSHLLDQILSVNDGALTAILQRAADLQNLDSNNEVKRSIASQNLLKEMGNLCNENTNILSIVLYNEKADAFIAKNRSDYLLSEKMKQSIREMIGSDEKRDILTGEWEVGQFEGVPVLIRGFSKFGNDFAVLVPIEYWMDQLVYNDGIFIGLTDEKGKPLYWNRANEFASEWDGNLPVREASFWTANKRALLGSLAVQNLRVYVGVPLRFMTAGTHALQAIIILIAIATLLVTLWLIRFSRKSIIDPTNLLLDTMRHIESGEYDHRLPETAPNVEFYKINQDFNKMLTTIVDLKMKSYEERIQFDEATLKYVQLQIRPHFFLNALTTIHSMTYQDRNQDIREYIERLSENVRYLFKAGLHTVPLSEEIDHVRVYIGMQNMQYPDAVFEYIDIEDVVRDYQIPQLLIHTLVENIYKHAVSIDHLTCILINAKAELKDGQEMCHISVEDDGDGFPASFLHQVGQGDVHAGKDGHGIGLWNLKKTLSLMYRREDLIQFSNKEPHGSRTDLWIPRRAKRQSSIWKL